MKQSHNQRISADNTPRSLEKQAKHYHDKDTDFAMAGEPVLRMLLKEEEIAELHGKLDDLERHAKMAEFIFLAHIKSIEDDLDPEDNDSIDALLVAKDAFNMTKIGEMAEDLRAWFSALRQQKPGANREVASQVASA